MSMAMEHPTPQLTYDDYMALPEGRHELIDGILYTMASPTVRHQRIQMTLSLAIASHVRQHRLGRVYGNLDIVLRRANPARVFQPDLQFIARENAGIVTAPNVQGMPDLIVEILSPSNARHDAVLKRRLYEEHGLGEYWMVLNETDQVEVLRRGPDGRFERPVLYEAGDTLTTPLLPGFGLEVATLFEEDDG